MSAEITNADRQMAAEIGEDYFGSGSNMAAGLTERVAQLLADQREQLTPRGLGPVAMNTDELLEVLAGITNTVRARDSYGGSIEYDAMDGPPCPDCKGQGVRQFDSDGTEACPPCAGWGRQLLPEDKQYWVRGVYRIGNSEGQGGVRMIGEVH